MKITDKGLSIIKHYEGVRLNAYLCPKGIPTIGYGHTSGVSMGDTITQAQADEFLKKDVGDAESQVTRLALGLNQNQFDAVVSLVFNIGIGQFMTSTVLKIIRGDEKGVSMQEAFGRWRKSDGKVLPGLVKRRRSEAILYETGELKLF